MWISNNITPMSPKLPDYHMWPATWPWEPAHKYRKAEKPQSQTLKSCKGNIRKTNEWQKSCLYKSRRNQLNTTNVRIWFTLSNGTNHTLWFRNCHEAANTCIGLGYRTNKTNIQWTLGSQIYLSSQKKFVGQKLFLNKKNQKPHKLCIVYA